MTVDRRLTREGSTDTDRPRPRQATNRTPTAGAGGLPTPGHPVARARRRRGNQAIQRLARERGQAKLSVGSPDDRYEREADRVADQVVARSASSSAPAVVGRQAKRGVQRMCPRCQARQAAGKPLDCPDCEEELQRKETASGAPTAGADRQVRTALGGGDPLPGTVRADLEPRLGDDFGDVRVHTGPAADAAARAVHAEAFTLGRDVVFSQGAYRPETSDGRWLLAHELTHVVQQRGAAPASTIQRECRNGTWEFEYDGCSVPGWVAWLAGIDKDNPAGGSDTHFAYGVATDEGGRACDRHDECYQTCGSDQAECDRRMHQDMVDICNRTSEGTDVMYDCLVWANRYYEGLRSFGGSAHRERQEQVCGCEGRAVPE